MAEPPSAAELAMARKGARVARLPAQLLGGALDPKTLQLLGKLYVGIIVPESWDKRSAQMALAAGIPVVCQGQASIGPFD